MDNVIDISKLLQSKKHIDLYERFYELKEKAISNLTFKEQMEFNELFADYQMSVLDNFANEIIETFNKKHTDLTNGKNKR